MAIEIPSKSIYKIDNKKILDNVYNSIECSYNEIDYVDDSIFNIDIDSFEIQTAEGDAVDVFNKNASDTFIINSTYNISFSETILGSTINHSVVRSNGYIICEAPLITRYDSAIVRLKKNINFQTSSTSKEGSITGSDISLQNQEYNSFEDFLSDIPSSSNRKLNDYFGIKKNSEKEFILFYDIWRKDAETGAVSLTITRMSFNLNTIAKVIKQTNVAIKGSESPVLGISTNELINSATEVQNTQTGTTQDYIDVLNEQIKYGYSKGLETATIKCSVSNYYTYLGNTKEKSIDDDNKEMLFKIGDEVVPMKKTINGDEPLSMKNGMAKVFVVNGVNITNSGAIWQELDLVEKATPAPVKYVLELVKNDNIASISYKLGDEQYITVTERTTALVADGTIVSLYATPANNYETTYTINNPLSITISGSGYVFSPTATQITKVLSLAKNSNIESLSYRIGSSGSYTTVYANTSVQIPINSSVYLYATPTSGYETAYTSSNPQVITMSNNYTFSPTATIIKHTLTITKNNNISSITYGISDSSSQGGNIRYTTVTSNTTVQIEHNAYVVLYATPASGYTTQYNTNHRLTFYMSSDYTFSPTATALDWHIIWSGSQHLHISTDSSVGFNTMYTEFTSLSEQVKSTYKFKVTVSNNNGVTNDTIETDTGGKNYVEGSVSKYVGYTVYPPTYLSNTSVRIRVKTTDTRGFYAPTMKATKIEAYY